MKTIKFPDVAGKNLKRKKSKFPEDFPAKYNIVLMAFYRQQQLDINTWLPYVDQLVSNYLDLAYLEFPVIYKMSPIGQFMLNEGMRAGIPDQQARENTITLYLDKTRFLEQLGIQSEAEIRVMLVKKDGSILWHGGGIFTHEKGSHLEDVLLSHTSLKRDRGMHESIPILPEENSESGAMK